MTSVDNKPIINTPPDFHFGPVDFDRNLLKKPLVGQQPIGLPDKNGNTSAPVTPEPTQAPLGPKGTTFPNPVSGPPIPQVPNENVLQLNLTTETLSFSNPLGIVPNRGLGQQQDIDLNGIPYVQVINDVTNPVTGKADGQPTGIHFEPGLWMHVPETVVDPVLPESLARMASIPHGTTINAQTISPPTTISGPPDIQSVDMSPFIINGGKIPPFAAQTASKTDTPRLPQDLSLFIAAGTITQEILTDPNTVLRNAIAGQTITSTTIISVSTLPQAPNLGGGTANIAFLEGTGGGIQGNSSAPAANADAVLMSATFWVETVEHSINIPIWNPGMGPLHLQPIVTKTGIVAKATQQPVPSFVITPTNAVTVPHTIKVHSTQIQYSQVVNLNFAGLTWPHVSVATLVPVAPIKIHASALSGLN